MNEEIHLQIERKARRILRRRATWLGVKRYVSDHWPILLAIAVAGVGIAAIIAEMI